MSPFITITGTITEAFVVSENPTDPNWPLVLRFGTTADLYLSYKDALSLAHLLRVAAGAEEPSMYHPTSEGPSA